ncbi:MAG: hypothetical protein AB7Q29_18540 [Vicinamibacterales bacterium]
MLTYACAIVLMGASFARYAMRFSPVGRWQAGDYDPADYRYVAEYFWGLPIVPSTYDAIWNGPWGTYLQTIPFRTIGLGSLYLVTGWLKLGHAPATPDEIVAAGAAFAWLQKGLLAVAILTLFAVVRRGWGTPLAFLALLLAAFPPDVWRLSDDFLTEPVHRILFLLAAACAVAMHEPRRTVPLAFALTALWFVATHLKVQWYVGALLLFPVLLYQLWRARASLSAMLALGVATAAVPLSVVAVNWIGWRSTSLSPGVGLHVNLRYDQAVLPAYSVATAGSPDRPPFADLEQPRLRWWLIHISPRTTQDQYEAFDRFGQQYLRRHMGAALGHFWEGLASASTIPGVERIEDGRLRLLPLPEPWHSAVRVLDLAVWLLLIAGLAYEETRVFSALSLVLWVVPAIGNVASLYELRYHLPMAGIPALAAAIVAVRAFAGQRVGGGSAAASGGTISGRRW